MTLNPGEYLWWHYRHSTWLPGTPEFVNPMTVVRDDTHGLVAWLAPGTEILKMVLATGEELRTAPLGERFGRQRSMAKATWRGEGILRIAPTGMPWSVWLFWEPGWGFAGWYINLETPIRRAGPDVYTEDHVLDVWVTPDRVCHRKDEDELVGAVGQGRFTADEAGSITRNAALAEQAVASSQFPFGDDWQSWRPDPAWKLPSLSPGASWDFDLTPSAR